MGRYTCGVWLAHIAHVPSGRSSCFTRRHAQYLAVLEDLAFPRVAETAFVRCTVRAPRWVSRPGGAGGAARTILLRQTSARDMQHERPHLNAVFADCRITPHVPQRRDGRAGAVRHVGRQNFPAHRLTHFTPPVLGASLGRIRTVSVFSGVRRAQITYETAMSRPFSYEQPRRAQPQSACRQSTVDLVPRGALACPVSRDRRRGLARRPGRRVFRIRT
jgi:hypothetical protein